MKLGSPNSAHITYDLEAPCCVLDLDVRGQGHRARE